MLLAVPDWVMFVPFVPVIVGSWLVTTKKRHWLVTPLVETSSGEFAPTRWCRTGTPLVA